jgi:hypothetical protein
MPSDHVLCLSLRYLIGVRDSMKDTGLSGDVLEAEFEKVVRAVWPVAGTHHWRCAACRDTGWEMLHCPETPCGRPNLIGPKLIAGKENHTGKGACEGGHDYVRPCRTCQEGDLRRENVRYTPPDFSNAAKPTAKPMGRFGR